ncbi:MAG: RluA family pseudouridine synthase [Myxococcota bacterium]
MEAEAGLAPSVVRVGAEQAGERLDRFLASRLAISRARVRHLLEVGRIVHAGRPLALGDKARPTQPGDEFRILGTLRAKEERPEPKSELPLVVVAERHGWLVVDKPAGCGVHPLRPDQQDTVLNAVVARHPEIVGIGEGGLRSGVVHRLDVDTTGTLVFALDSETWRRLRGAFADHRVEKRYLALVAGRFERARSVELTLAITRHSPARVEVRERGRRCRMHVAPRAVFAASTLVEVALETGFLHQIRASMVFLGHPVLGDRDYGGMEGAAAAVTAASGATRPMLHAWRLAVDEIEASVPPPADFEAARARLEVASA